MERTLCFPRTRNLATKADFKNVFDNPFKVSQKHLLVLFKPNKKKLARLGVIVGKRVAKSAVARNRIKRIVRESFRLKQDVLTGWDIIVIARQQSNILNRLKLRKGIDDLWEKLLTHYQKYLS